MQDTPNRLLKIAPAGTGVALIRQPVPVLASARVTWVPDRFS